MNKDFPFNVEFSRHPRTLRLIKKLGHRGAFSLISLWASATKYYHKGRRYDMHLEGGARL